MAWPTFTVDVTQNSNQIKVYGPVPASQLPAGFEAIINGIGNLEVSYGTAVMYDGSNNPYSHLYLARPYKGSTASNVEMVVKPTGSQFNDVVSIFQNASNLLNSTMAGFRQFVEGTSPVSFQPLDENAEPISIKPLLQMNQEAQAAVNQAISAFQNAAGTAAGYDVTSSTTDTGNGANGKPKLLRVGDGGILGNPIPIASGNLDSVIVPGVYAVSSGTIGNPTNDNGVLIVSLRAANRIHHRFLQLGGQNFVGEYERVSYGSMLWSPFEKVLTTGNTGTAVGYDVTSNATDKTPNRLLKVGDFGLGGGGLYGFFGLDLNNYIETGVYRNSSHANWNNSTNKPPSIATALNQTFVLTVDRNQSSALTQMLHVESNRFFIRARNITDTWTPWREVLHTGNLVGTVSQSSSVPTGAIIQRGSNANGEYTKFADGTMICVADKSLTFGSSAAATIGGLAGFRTSSGDVATQFTLPSSFSGEFSVVISSRVSTGPLIILGGGRTSDSVAYISAFSTMSWSNLMQTFNYVCIGRWY
jgi:hypothetical protein